MAKAVILSGNYDEINGLPKEIVQGMCKSWQLLTNRSNIYGLRLFLRSRLSLLD